MARAKGKNPFLSGFLTGLAVGLALAVAVALLVTRNNPFVDKNLEAASGSAAPASPVEAPRYEFYQPPPASDTAAAPAAAPVPAGTNYYLQAGAFGNAADAEEMKARLALLGVEARIVAVQEGEKPLHKLRIGPYQSLDELNAVRARLTQGGMETMLIKIGPEEKP